MQSRFWLSGFVTTSTNSVGRAHFPADTDAYFQEDLDTTPDRR